MAKLPVYLPKERANVFPFVARCTRASQNSYSTAAQTRRVNSGTYLLTYNYVNRPRPAVRDEIPIHDGAAILTISGRGRPMTLERECWTNRHTTGGVALRLRSPAVLEDFPPGAPLALSRKLS